MMVGALVVVLPVTDEYVKTPRFQVISACIARLRALRLRRMVSALKQ